jgi:hypothetical protein
VFDRVPPALVKPDGRPSAAQQPQPQLRPLEVAPSPDRVPARLGHADDVVRQPLSLGLRQPLLQMGAGEFLMQKM